jgi:hypothetical protein
MPFPLIPLALAAGSALAGGLASKTGNKGKWTKKSLLTPEQRQMSEWARTQGQHQIQNPTQGFEPISQHAQNVFKQQTVPSLAERFTSLGSGSALSSPAFNAQLGQAGQGLSESLAAMMAQYGLQQQNLGQGLMGMGMWPEYENVYKAGGPSFLSGTLGGLSSGLGSMANGGFGNYFNSMMQPKQQQAPAWQQQSQNQMPGGSSNNYMNQLAMKLGLG